MRRMDIQESHARRINAATTIDARTGTPTTVAATRAAVAEEPGTLPMARVVDGVVVATAETEVEVVVADADAAVASLSIGAWTMSIRITANQVMTTRTATTKRPSSFGLGYDSRSHMLRSCPLGNKGASQNRWDIVHWRHDCFRRYRQHALDPDELSMLTFRGALSRVPE